MNNKRVPEIKRKVTLSKIRLIIHFKLLDFIDCIADRKIAGRNLTKTEPSPFYNLTRGIGMTPSQPARYLILKRVFSFIHLSKSDILIDVGCGKGRVLAFLLKHKCPCLIYGVELSRIPGEIAAQWTKKYNNVFIILDNAFMVDYNQYTVLFLSQPFYPVTFFEFIELLEKQLSHSITLIYLFDHSSGYYLENRAGWELQYREEFLKIKGIQVVSDVRRFSIWHYEPSITRE